jgi:hypothetical protein
MRRGVGEDQFSIWWRGTCDSLKTDFLSGKTLGLLKITTWLERF